MAKQESVNVKWQTLFAIVPILYLYAAYRIEKLRLILLITISFGVIRKLVDLSFGGPIDHSGMIDDFLVIKVTSTEYWIVDTIIIVVQTILDVYLIRLWSKNWNEKVSTNTSR